MFTRVLRIGSRGEEVEAVQLRLNERHGQLPPLEVTGVYDDPTARAVRRFQHLEWLVEDGIVGTCTWNALMGTEAYAPLLHDVPMIPQPTPTTCWAASTAMLTNSTVQEVIARTPPGQIAHDGGLRNLSGTDDFVTKSEEYAQAHGLAFEAPMSWLPSGLGGLLIPGPMMFDMLWNADEFAQGAGSPGHMVAVIGMRGDNAPSGRGTTLRIHDPWPPNEGRRYSKNYYDWVQELATITYRIFRTP